MITEFLSSFKLLTPSDIDDFVKLAKQGDTFVRNKSKKSEHIKNILVINGRPNKTNFNFA